METVLSLVGQFYCMHVQIVLSLSSPWVTLIKQYAIKKKSYNGFLYILMLVNKTICLHIIYQRHPWFLYERVKEWFGHAYNKLDWPMRGRSPYMGYWYTIPHLTCSIFALQGLCVYKALAHSDMIMCILILWCPVYNELFHCCNG